MSAARAAITVTALAVGGLCGWFSILKWNEAGQVATIVSALAAVASIGMAVWAAVRQPGRRSITVKRSGKAVSGVDGRAVTGVSDTAVTSGDLVVEDSGDADARKGGDAITGID